MATAVRNTVTHLKQPLAQALNMASLYPAQYLQLFFILGFATWLNGSLMPYLSQI